MKLTFSTPGDFDVECRFNLNGKTAPVEWKVTAPGLPKSNSGYYDEAFYANWTSNKMYFDWSAVKNAFKRSDSAARVVCMSKGHGFGWNQVETQVRRGAQDLV